MLDPVAQLAQDRVGDVGRVLGDEIDPDALGADQAHHLLDLLQQGLRRIAEEQVSLVEEEGELGTVGVADLGQDLEELGHQPEQEGGVEAGGGDQPVGGQDADIAPAGLVPSHEVAQVQGGLPEQSGAALVLEDQQLSLDGRHRGCRDIAIARAQGGGVLGGEGQGRLQVLQVQEQQALLVGGPEHHGQHALLHVIEFEHAGDEQGPHLRDRRPDGVALFAEEVPEQGRRGLGNQLQVHGARPRQHLLPGLAGGGDAAEVALHVGGEDRHPGVRQTLGQDLQGDGLPGPRRPGDKSVPVGAIQAERLGLA